MMFGPCPINELIKFGIVDFRSRPQQFFKRLGTRRMGNCQILLNQLLNIFFRRHAQALGLLCNLSELPACKTANMDAGGKG